MIYSCRVILISNKKQTINTHENIDKSQNYYAEQNNPDKERIHFNY